MSADKATRAAHGTSPPKPGVVLAEIETIAWLDLVPPDPVDVLCHLYRECGRLGVDADRLPEPHAVVLSDVRAWLDHRRPEALARAAVDFERSGRADGGPEKPAVRIRAGLTSKGSLAVRWEWSPQRFGGPRRLGPDDRRPNLRLVGAYGGYATPPPSASAPRGAGLSQELIFIRGVVGLGGIPRGRQAASELEPLSALLVLLVRGCYESLLKQLSQHVEIELADRFVFTFARSQRRPFQQLQSWAIVEAQPQADSLIGFQSDRHRAGEFKVVAIDARHAR